MWLWTDLIASLESLRFLSCQNFFLLTNCESMCEEWLHHILPWIKKFRKHTHTQYIYKTCPKWHVSKILRYMSSCCFCSAPKLEQDLFRQPIRGYMSETWCSLGVLGVFTRFVAHIQFGNGLRDPLANYSVTGQSSKPSLCTYTSDTATVPGAWGDHVKFNSDDCLHTHRSNEYGRLGAVT